MKAKLFIFISLISFYVSAQDPSFSHIDLNSMYMNPAFCGSSGGTKFLSIRREQWKGINGSGSQFSIGGNSPFTNSLIEASTLLYYNNGRHGGVKSINFGISALTEDNIFNNDLEGGVFLKRTDYSGYLSFLFQLDNIRSLKKYRWLQEKYIQFGVSAGNTNFGLDADNLVFSNMIDAYGETYPLITNLPYNSIENKRFPRLSAGVLLSMFGNNSSTKRNATIIGYSFQTLNENFQQSSLRSLKHSFHIEHKGTTPVWIQEGIPHWKIFYKSEHYKTNAWNSRKYEFGQSLEIFHSLLEIGQIFRFNSNLNTEGNDLHLQTWIPFLRMNLPVSRHLLQISYILHEGGLENNKDNYLYAGQTGNTHEISLTLHLFTNRPKKCIEFGQNKHNGLVENLKRNALRRK